MEETIVFLDGGYLDKISKYFGSGKPIRIDLNQFAITLSKENELWCKETYYYTAPPYQSPKPTEEEKKRRKNYDMFINKISKIPNFYVRQGRCQKGANNNEFHQKGVDTLLTMDLFSRCSKKDIKTIILLACDTDFVPILKTIQGEYNIKVILAYFCDYMRKSAFSMSNHILTSCDLKFLLKKEHFDKSLYIQKT